MTDGTTENSVIDRPEYHSALANGLVVGRYKILAVLGEGGFGITYRCHDTQLHRDVATGYFTAAQKAALMTEVAPAIAKWEAAQWRAFKWPWE